MTTSHVIEKVPTTIIVGFLGSGKTTIISHLIDYVQSQNQQVVFIKNEVGDQDLDAQLLKGKIIQTRELLNGCICCTLVGPLNNVIDELLEKYHPDRIIIESAGTADPSSLALTIDHHPGLVRDGLITIIDVLNFEGYEDLNPIARRQAEFTDLIVFNKVELADEQRKLAVVGYVREFNEKAPIVEAPSGVLNPNVAFGISPKEMNSLLAEHTHPDHLHDDNINAFTYISDKPFDKSKLLTVFQNLPKNVFRIKGVVVLDAGVKKVVNGVFKRFDFVEPPSNVHITENKIIFIGYQVHLNEAEIRTRLAHAVVS